MLRSRSDQIPRSGVAFERCTKVVTSIWANGDVGPVCIHFAPSSHISRDVIAKMNTAYKGRLWVTISRTPNHFMDAESTLDYWELCLAPAFAHRRAKLGMADDSAVGGLLFDKFCGNDATSSGAAARRDVFSTRNNIKILEPILGGGSAKTQPCDGAHSYFRQVTDAAEDHILGESSDPLKRNLLEQLMSESVGSLKKEITAEEVTPRSS